MARLRGPSDSFDKKRCEANMARSENPRHRRRRKREALVYAHLEHVSRDLLESHPDVVRDFIGRNAGVYALYKKGRLYYVGLATALRGRLKAHGKNRHGKGWDSFSIYLMIKDQHLREIEALLLRIASPFGAKQRGKLAQSRDMRRSIIKAIKQKQNREVSSLFIKLGEARAAVRIAGSPGRDPDLIRLNLLGARLRGIHKGKIHQARIRRDGRIRYNGSTYPSLSVAGKAAIKRGVNGWWFWRAERGKGNWERLTKLRRAGTPLYSR
jgi:Restriction Enzyme Adenine Methylase Associated